MTSIDDNANKVKDILIDYFGEDRVDFIEAAPHGFAAIIWFPVVLITNEFGESTTARDIFVKFGVTHSGKLRYNPIMTRATFTKAEAMCGYVHSHCSGYLPTSPNNYNSLCFGTGPINSTMSSLMVEFDESLWMLFCGELDLYVKTESVSGVPYKRLSSIGGSYEYRCQITVNTEKSASTTTDELAFYKWFLKNYDVPVVYDCGMYRIAMSNIEFTLLVGEALNERYSTVWPYNIFKKSVILKNGKLYRSSRDDSVTTGVRDDIYIDFKGRRIPRTIIDNDESEAITVDIPNQATVATLYSIITRLIIYKYDRTT